MNAILICYDLNAPGQDYDKVRLAIEGLGAWCRFQRSSWVVKTNLNPTQVRDYLLQKTDRNDSLFVSHLYSQSAWSGLDPDVSKWLLANL